MLKVSPWKGIMRFDKRGKLSPRFVGPFPIKEKVGEVAYKLKLPEELWSIHNTYHVSNLRKCLADERTTISLKDVQVDERLNYIEELQLILDKEVRKITTMSRSKTILELDTKPLLMHKASIEVDKKTNMKFLKHKSLIRPRVADPWEGSGRHCDLFSWELTRDRIIGISSSHRGAGSTVRSKVITLVKVQWKFHKGQHATWESEIEMKANDWRPTIRTAQNSDSVRTADKMIRGSVDKGKGHA
ncbi:hypothetical protein OSB04_025215 [Centaurea solstitialis]|uniref:Tf2-1-like SH3-like domain-containing protein n=1 Tax=Centaurea solstitialis TaxID=347529 RepID=A0AA38SV90_9ASTR|nr:hypothetical protein OSB04_025215 [Centaurea solstitialis]